MAYLSRKKAPYPSVRAPGVGAGLRALGGLLRAALPMLVIWGGVGAGVGRLWTLAFEDPAFRVGGHTQDFGGAAGDCREARDELVRLGSRLEGRSLLDPRLPGDIREIYGESPWIREVQSVRKLLPNRLEIVYRLRLPVAQIRHEGRYWRLDVEGAVLPAAGSRWPAAGLPVIDGDGEGAFGRRPAEGEVWNDRGVQDALTLILTLWASPLAETVPPARVTVHAGTFLDGNGAERVRRARLSVATANGRLIRWGTFNAGDLPGEPTSAQKLWLLREMLAREPVVPEGEGTRGAIIDISAANAPVFALPAG